MRNETTSTLQRAALFTLAFIVAGTLIVIAGSAMGVIGPSSSKTVSKTIVVEYNLGNYNSPDGTQNPGGSETAFEKQYNLTIPEDAAGTIGVSLQLSANGAGNCEGNFAAFICERTSDEMTIKITRVDTNAAWDDSLYLKAMYFCE